VTSSSESFNSAAINVCVIFEWSPISKASIYSATLSLSASMAFTTFMDVDT